MQWIVINMSEFAEIPMETPQDESEAAGAGVEADRCMTQGTDKRENPQEIH